MRQENNRGIHIHEVSCNSPQVPDATNGENLKWSKAKCQGKSATNGKFSNGENSKRSKAKDKGKRPESVESEAPYTSNEEMENITQSKTRVKRKRKEPVVVDFNEKDQYVGEYAAEFSTFLGETARGLVPLTVHSWFRGGLTDDFKSQIWKHIFTFYTVDGCHKKIIFQKMAKLWREYRGKIRKEVRQQVAKVGLKTAARNTIPSNVHSMEDWLTFIKIAMSPTQMKKRERFKMMRMKKELVHRTSRTSFANVEHKLKMASKDPKKVTRTDVWLYGYTPKKKKDNGIVEDPEVVKKVREKASRETNLSQRSIDDDPVSHVLGPEKSGRIRGYGFGALPSRLSSQAYVGSRMSKMEQEIQDLKMLIERLLPQQNTRDWSTECSNVPTSPIQLTSSKGETSKVKKRNKGETSTIKKRKEGGTSTVTKRKEGETSMFKKRKEGDTSVGNKRKKVNDESMVQ